MIDPGDFLSKLSGIVSVIPRQYVDAILALHDTLDGKGIEWIVNGEAAESLETVDVEPQYLEIVCSRRDAEQFHKAVTEFSPSPLTYLTQRLPDNAVYQGNQYPVFQKSHYFDFSLRGIQVRVHGDLQFRVNDWEWGDVFEFTPNYVSIVGRKTAVTPLPILLGIYESLGWTEKARRIRIVLEKRTAMRERSLAARQKP